ncbi:ras-related protein Rab-24-like protein [Leptotrombidium deliense]|uniref:Ras-related protein Rab-24-like protein n=1 Tax=Leptotrombidium deliense TaxID=299467 RepID=A0A443S4Y3_9ACAR|nr:ras-related protein Rab-24-like protein [Leptotrombidium deliense]
MSQYLRKITKATKYKYVSHSTIGAQFEVLNQNVDDKQLKLIFFVIKKYIRSTGGNERYDVVARRLLSDQQCKAAIVCVDLQDFRTYEKLNYWLQELKIFEKIRIYFCVLKSDLIDISQRMFGVELLKYRAKEMNAKVFVTSSKTGEGIQKMVAEITRDLISEL